MPLQLSSVGPKMQLSLPVSVTNKRGAIFRQSGSERHSVGRFAPKTVCNVTGGAVWPYLRRPTEKRIIELQSEVVNRTNFAPFGQVRLLFTDPI